MKLEESGYSIELEQAANGITRKETKQINCVHQRKKTRLTIQSDKSKRIIRELNQGNFLVSLRNSNSRTQDSHICVKMKTTLSLLKRIKF